MGQFSFKKFITAHLAQIQTNSLLNIIFSSGLFFQHFSPHLFFHSTLIHFLNILSKIFYYKYKRKNPLLQYQNFYNYNIFCMGGDAFEGTQKLTNIEYEELVHEILTKLSELYQRAQAYVPLPEKDIHGDLDFLMILKPGVSGKDVIQCLNIERYILNHNQTINSVYKNKQVDFCFKKGDQSFEITKFYKSYSGMGAHLGLFLPSKEVKLSDDGLFALAYRDHIKFQFLLTRSIRTILQFYGLDYQRYQEGFKTRKELFEYLRKCVFMNEKKMLDYGDNKNQSKLSKFFLEYLKIIEVPKQQPQKVFKQPLKDTLKYFNKQAEFEKQFQSLLDEFDRKQKLNKKFNATHIMDYFNIEAKKVNKIKEEFKSQFSTNQEYFKYIQDNSNQQILSKMEKVLNLKRDQTIQKKQHKKYQKKHRVKKQKNQKKEEREKKEQSSQEKSQDSTGKEEQRKETIQKII